MALNSLKYDPKKELETNAQGSTIFDGKPHEFFDWRFRMEMKQELLSAEDNKAKKLKIVDQVFQGLRGDAKDVAKTVGVKALIQDGGIDHLVRAMLDMIFPKKDLEAKELYDAGHKKEGILTRQHGESMLSFIDRRKRWYASQPCECLSYGSGPSVSALAEC